MFKAYDLEGAEHWAKVMNKTQCGVYVKAAERLPQDYVEEAEVLEGHTVVDVGDRLLFYK